MTTTQQSRYRCYNTPATTHSSGHGHEVLSLDQSADGTVNVAHPSPGSVKRRKVAELLHGSTGLRVDVKGQIVHRDRPDALRPCEHVASHTLHRRCAVVHCRVQIVVGAQTIGEVALLRRLNCALVRALPACHSDTGKNTGCHCRSHNDTNELCGRHCISDTGKHAFPDRKQTRCVWRQRALCTATNTRTNGVQDVDDGGVKVPDIRLRQPLNIYCCGAIFCTLLPIGFCCALAARNEDRGGDIRGAICDHRKWRGPTAAHTQRPHRLRKRRARLHECNHFNSRVRLRKVWRQGRSSREGEHRQHRDRDAGHG